MRTTAPDMGTVADAAASFVLSGGKRLRPAFCYWGWRGAGGHDGESVVLAAASLELLHAGALVHDDVMDGSDTRRGRPAVHRGFSGLHRSEEWRGDPDAFGANAAILVGDLCLIWSDMMLSGCGAEPDALRRARLVYDDMRMEVMTGQYLDLVEQVSGRTSLQGALRVARHKTARYTVERPLQMGAALARDDPELVRAYSGYGLPLGEAFQLRDDVLGVFGDPQVTGKPAGDDLREGKRTALIAVTLELATPEQAARVRRHLGDPLLDEGGVCALQQVIRETGALRHVEQLIAQRAAEATAALDHAPVASDAVGALRSLAEAATARLG
jgi:geranylgeranyl diphosphate synthase type I